MLLSLHPQEALSLPSKNDLQQGKCILWKDLSHALVFSRTAYVKAQYLLLSAELSKQGVSSDMKQYTHF